MFLVIDLSSVVKLWATFCWGESKCKKHDSQCWYLSGIDEDNTTKKVDNSELIVLQSLKHVGVYRGVHAGHTWANGGSLRQLLKWSDERA